MMMSYENCPDLFLFSFSKRHDYEIPMSVAIPLTKALVEVLEGPQTVMKVMRSRAKLVIEELQELVRSFSHIHSDSAGIPTSRDSIVQLVECKLVTTG